MIKNDQKMYQNLSLLQKQQIYVQFLGYRVCKNWS